MNYQPSFVDGIGARIVFPQMLERAFAEETELLQLCYNQLTQTNGLLCEAAESE